MMRRIAVVIATGIVLTGGCGPGPQDTTDENEERRPVLMPFKMNGLWAYGDENGRVVVEPRFDEALIPDEGIGAVRAGQVWGFVGDQYFFGLDFSEGLAAVCFEGFVEVDGIDPDLGLLSSHQRCSSAGYIDRAGRDAMEHRFQYSYPFTAGFAHVTDGDRAGYIDSSGRWILGQGS